MSSAKLRYNNGWVLQQEAAYLPPKGPSGLWTPPLTPAYSTPATYFASSFAELQTTLGQCSGGEVIEITAALRGSSVEINKVTGSNPSANWTQNVLVRPPIGQRVGCDPFELHCQHVTMAGFNFDTPGARQITRIATVNEPVSMTSSGSFSGFWRCVDTYDVSNTTNSVKWGISAGFQAFVIECAAPYYHPTIKADRFDIYGGTRGGFATGVIEPIIKGCFFSGCKKDVTVDQSQLHVDNLQIEGPGTSAPTVFSPSILHSVVDGGSGNSAIFCKNLVGDIYFHNTWVGFDGSDGANYSLGFPAGTNQWDSTCRSHVTYCDFGTLMPRIENMSSVPADVATFHGNRCAQNTKSDNEPANFYGSFAKADDGSNVFNLAPIVRPALADLTVVWPECPLSITETVGPEG